MMNLPLIDYAMLRAYSEGLICLSGGRHSEITKLLLRGMNAQALEVACNYAKLFGEGDFYLEIQNHGLPDEELVLYGMSKISKKTGIPLAATNDAHYLTPADHRVHKLLSCIRTGAVMSESVRDALPNDRYDLKSTAEMNELFAQYPEALRCTEEIAQRCNVQFTFGVLRLPRFSVQGVRDNAAYLRALCHDGFRVRYGENPPEGAEARMEYELDVISRMGYVDYFLIVWDFVRYARTHDIPVGPGRGSGAGSLCAYCIGITDIDPLKNGLLFERFLNPERVSMPDFDIDFCIEGRQQVIAYVRQKYGRDRVTQIVAFDTLKARAAVRDTARALELPYMLRNDVAKAIPAEQNITIAQALEQSEELRALRDGNQSVQMLLELAQEIEGMPRHTTVHAAGVVISAEPVTEFVPVQRSDDVIVTQYTMTYLEQLGMLKMDFLGLRNLTVIHETERQIQRRFPDFSVRSIPEDDAAVFTMLSAGDSMGVFQMESDGVRRVLTRMRPTCISDLTAVISLYRPGPMDSIPQYLAARADPAKVRYDHPLLEPILKETFGCIVYQEQVMEICRTLAGYSYGRADLVRRAMAKKKHDVMEQEREVFLHGNENCCGAVANGVPEETANAIFDRMAAFASYAFNKSHAAAYARVAYETAYLKCRYPNEYFAALMTSVIQNTAKLTEYANICTERGIRILPPDINQSEAVFTAAGDGIRFGLLGIRGLGQSMIDTFLQDRAIYGPYRSLYNFCSRNAGPALNVRVLESLVHAGAFDCFGSHRRQMAERLDTMVNFINMQKRTLVSGQLSLFGETMDSAEPAPGLMQLPDVPEYPESVKLQMEHDVLGMYLTGHPLARFQPYRQLLHLPEIADIRRMKHNAQVMLLCMVREVRKHVTKKGEKMCYLTVEDNTGTLDCLVFKSVYPSVKDMLLPDSVIWMMGRFSDQNGEKSLICESVLTENSFLELFGNRRLCFKVADSDRAQLAKLMEICRRFPGQTPFVFWMTETRRYLVPKHSAGVALDSRLMQCLSEVIPLTQCALIEQKE